MLLVRDTDRSSRAAGDDTVCHYSFFDPPIPEKNKNKNFGRFFNFFFHIASSLLARLISDLKKKGQAGLITWKTGVSVHTRS